MLIHYENKRKHDNVKKVVLFLKILTCLLLSRPFNKEFEITEFNLAGSGCTYIP